MANEKARLQVKTNEDPEVWEDVGTGEIGPPLSTGSKLYAIKQTVSGDITYVGKAVVGSSQSSAVWQAQKIDETSGMVVTWADGDGKFDNIATDLTALSYS